ncbi:MAG: DUF4956 domain-containing protein [Rhodothermaceae bacterium]|nr:DUF4956 domain-containing protein [Rhodothermaceae bacterium]
MQDPIPSFEEFLATQSVQIPTWGFVINLLCTALLAFVLSKFYTRFGRSLSNRKQFSANFVLIAMTTMLIISIVKASLALSLGLVGALSIVRFRSAIKEPEELAYLFLVIGLGLGFGADQRVITFVAFAVILGIMWLGNRRQTIEKPANLYLTVSTNGQGKIPLQDMVNAIQSNCSELELKRLNEDKERIEAAFMVSFKDIQELEATKSSLYNLSDSLHINLLDNNGLRGMN